VTKHVSLLSQQERAAALGQTGVVVWFTGLSGSGKSTLAMHLEAELVRSGLYAVVLDGDNVRHGLCGDLEFSEADRRENLRRIGHVAELFYQAGVITLCSFVSPMRQSREWVRGLVPKGQFLEVHVSTPLAVCEARDPKGLYRKARAGEIKEMTGIDAAYEKPQSPEFEVNTEKETLESAVSRLSRSIRTVLGA